MCRDLKQSGTEQAIKRPFYDLLQRGVVAGGCGYTQSRCCCSRGRYITCQSHMNQAREAHLLLSYSYSLQNRTVRTLCGQKLCPHLLTEIRITSHNNCLPLALSAAAVVSVHQKPLGWKVAQDAICTTHTCAVLLVVCTLLFDTGGGLLSCISTTGWLWNCET